MEFNKKKLITIGLGVTLLFGATLISPTSTNAAVQKPADQIFATQLNTGRNSQGNCSPASAKMILNAYGLEPNLTVQQISEDYQGFGHGDVVLEKLGIVSKFINNDDTLAKKYLDQGCVIGVGIYNGFGPHEGVALDYRTTNGYIEYYTLDPSKPDCEPYWARKDSTELVVGSVSVDNAYLYNKLEKFIVDDVSKSGNKYKLTLFYDKTSDMFLYSKEDGLKYTDGVVAACDIKADEIYYFNKDKNWFNKTDTIYAIKDHMAMINNTAYFGIDKAYVAKTWGIVR